MSCWCSVHCHKQSGQLHMLQMCTEQVNTLDVRSPNPISHQTSYLVLRPHSFRDVRKWLLLFLILSREIILISMRTYFQFNTLFPLSFCRTSVPQFPPISISIASNNHIWNIWKMTNVYAVSCIEATNYHVTLAALFIIIFHHHSLSSFIISQLIVNKLCSLFKYQCMLLYRNTLKLGMNTNDTFRHIQYRPTIPIPTTLFPFLFLFPWNSRVNHIAMKIDISVHAFSSKI